MPRIARVTAVGYPHHITQRGNNKSVVFFDDDDRRFYLAMLKRYAESWGLELWAYCLMSNHVHLLAVPEHDYSLARGIGGVNLVYTQYVNRKYKQSGRLWQNRFFSTVVEKDRYLWAVARYIERNPVRAGIVHEADAYAWSSCRAHVRGTANAYLRGRAWLQDSERSSYRALFREGDTEADLDIRKATSTGMPLGSGWFLERLEKELSRILTVNKVGRPKIRKLKTK